MLSIKEIVILLSNKSNLTQIIYAFMQNNSRIAEHLYLYKCTKKFVCTNDANVVTLDYEKEEKINKHVVVFKPLWKWLIGT